MAEHFDWHQPAPIRQRESHSVLPPPDRIGSWMVISLLTAIIIHIILFITLGHLKMDFGWTSTEEIVTEPIVVRPVQDDIPEEIPPSIEEDTPQPKPEQTTIVDEVEILQQLKDPELEMKPSIDEASYDVKVQLENPALAGDPAGDIANISAAVDISPNELESLGKTETITPSAAEGQMIVDPGSELADSDDLSTAMDELIKKGANGNSPNGVPDGTSSLDEIAGLPQNVLVTKTTMLPSDLLFEFNSDKLRTGAKVGMQKIALVMDLNPELYCWIDGHTDLIGTEVANDGLSRRRAQSVKNYLTSIGMNPDKIIIRGFGKRHPIIMDGDQNQQSANRRVELKMRKSPPSPDDMGAVPLKATPITDPPMPPSDAPPETPEEVAPKAIRVKPQRAIPVEEEMPAPRANPVQQPDAPRAAIIEEDSSDPAIESGAVEEQPPPPARVIQEPDQPLRAEPVEE